MHDGLYFIRKSLTALWVVLFLTPVVANAQSTEPTEIPWRPRPAIAGQNGHAVASTPGKVFIGQRNGEVHRYDFSLGVLGSVTVMEPGQELPADVEAIWDISIPAKDKVVALASYVDGAESRYGILISENLGESWTFLKPDAMKDPAFVVLQGGKFTGNFWRTALIEISWLDDGLHGWLWGRKGILRTTNGGMTWETVYKTANENSQSISEYEVVWGLAFKDANNGACVLGGAPNPILKQTNDGGKTWNDVGGSLGLFRVADLKYVGGKEYRLLGFNRFKTDDNTTLYFSATGAQWNSQKALGVISQENYMGELLWPGTNVGFMVKRMGEIWKTENGGKQWTNIYSIDASYPTLIFTDGTEGQGPATGYGQRSIFITDDFGDRFIIQVASDNANGILRDYIPVWPIDQFSSVPVTPGAATKLQLVVSPNPVSTTADVKFHLDSPTNVTMVVVDAIGNEVLRNDAGVLSDGENVVALDVSGLISGSYRCIVETATLRAAYPMVIVR